MEEDLPSQFPYIHIWGDIIRPDTIHRGMNCEQRNRRRPNRQPCSHICEDDLQEIEDEQAEIRAIDWSIGENGEKYHVRWLGRNTFLKENIDNRVVMLLQRIWEHAHQDNLDIRNTAKYIVAATVIGELWAFVTRIYDEEFLKIGKLKPPRELCEKFSRVLFILEETEERFDIGLKTFDRLIRLRTDVIADIRVLYRKHYRENHLGLPAIELPEWGNRYKPYDVDWLTSSANLCDKLSVWTHVSRINQWRQIQQRMTAENMRLYDEIPETIRAEGILEFEAKSVYEDMDPETLDKNQMQNYEQNECMKTLNVMHILELKEHGNRILTENKLRYRLMNAKHWLLMGKTFIAETLLDYHEIENYNPINLLQQLAMFTILETHILLLTETHSQRVHVNYGIFGQSCPHEVSHAIEKVVRATTRENCRFFPLSQEMITLLDSVRNGVKGVVKKYFLEQEELVEKIFVDNVFTTKERAEKITLTIPDDMKRIRRRIIVNLVWENIEKIRLDREVQMARELKLIANKINPHSFLHLAPGLHYSNYGPIVFAARTEMYNRCKENAEVWKLMTAYEKVYPKETQTYVKNEVLRFINSTFDKSTIVARQILAAAFCHAIIDNLKYDYFDESLRLIRKRHRRCERRIRDAARRCIGIFESVVEARCVLVTDAEKMMKRGMERLQEVDAEHFPDPRHNMMNHIADEDMSDILRNFADYVEFVAEILKAPYLPNQ